MSAHLMRGAAMLEWFSSRRDSPIVGRHEVPGSDAERQPRPGGTVEVVVSPVGSPGKNSPSLVSGSFKT
jgi:hypothetical protein